MSLTIIRDNSYHLMRNANKGAQVGNATLTDANLRSQAQVDGMKLFTEWMSKHDVNINAILSRFDENGVSLEPLSATTFSDLYKWTMMPVIRKLETAKGEITVTFGIDLRESDMRQAMMDDPALVDQIYAALTSLTQRMFDPAIFEAVNGIKNGILDDKTIEDICGTKASPRALVQEVKPLYTTPFDTPPTPGQVTLYMYKKTCDGSECTPYTYEKEKGNSKKKGTVSEGGQVYFIEAVGPWHKVTWLETSMMQCVYEAKLRYDLKTKEMAYGKWLYGALLRCAKSVAYTRLVQKYQTEGKLGKTTTPILPALFTGRRTGGFAFILLQNLFFADHFEQYSPENLKITPHCALGTSSVDAWSILTKEGMKCRTPAGTNAHELRMVTQILYPEIDTLAPNLPLTQVLVDVLYQREVQSKTGGPMPTLPDTLGTRAYLKAATYIKGKDGKPFLTQITSARQDSGELRVFIDNMNEFGYGFPAKSIMASEIDTSKTLLEAVELGYQHFGAGGFFGDSEKVWSINPEAPSNSMAVKAVRVSYEGIPEGFPFILNGVGYPVKLGDASGKMSLDKNLSSAQFGPIKAYYDAIKAAAAAAEVQGSMTVDELLRAAKMDMAGGRRRRQSQRKRKTKRGRHATRSGSTKTRR